MSFDQKKLAYAVAYSSSTSGYMGAILITDYKGFPLEFRYTDPIIPTKIQQVLYGDGIEKYIKLDVITDSLMKALSGKFSILLVQDDDMLEFKSESIVLIRVSSTKLPPLSQPGELSKVKKSEFLLQTSLANSPVRLQFSSYFNCEGEQFQSVITTLTEAGDFMDVDEPIGRVYKTLELICNQDT